MRLLTLTSILFLIIFNSAFSQSVPVMIKGKVIDKPTGKALPGVEVVFMDPTGKKIKIETNDIKGTFEQTLMSGTEYDVIIQDWDILRTEFTYKAETGGEFKELEKDFHVVQLKPGREIFNWDIFAPGGATLNNNCAEKLDKMQLLLRFNRSVKLEFLVAADEAVGNVEERVTALKKIIDKWKRSKHRIEIKPDPKSPADGKDLRIVVKEFKNVFE